MYTNIIWGIFVSIGVIIAYFAIHYLIIRFNLSKAVNEVITNVEDLEAAGKEKMKQAVEHLYGLIPPQLKAFISRAWIESLIQKAFDKMEAFAEKQIEKKAATQKTKTRRKAATENITE